VGFGPDRSRMMNVYCKEAPGSVVSTDPAGEKEGASIRCQRQRSSVTARFRRTNGRTTPSSKNNTVNAEIARAKRLSSYLL
jgi:hypothetical protein